MVRLVQLDHPENGRRVALVEEPNLVLLDQVSSAYQLALNAIDAERPIEDLVQELRSEKKMEYDPIYSDTSEWKLLPCFDHPENPHLCMLSGTGLTHKASAENRQKMHHAEDQGTITDSMKMYQIGVEGGKPGSGQIGAQPEWFYKGNGTMLRAHNQPLEIPAYAEDGGEEPEIAGVYVCGSDGTPFRVGFATCNEFSDHAMEKRNYLYLAPSKLRNCSIGPELVIGSDFKNIQGTVKVMRAKQPIWAQEIQSGEDNIVHSLGNLEYHHFKYANHRQPGMVNIHFMGADAFSFGANKKLQDGDLMEVNWEGMGRPLVNPVAQGSRKAEYFPVNPL